MQNMQTAREPMIAGHPAAAKSPWLSIVTKDQQRGAMPTNEELSGWLQAVARAGDKQAFAALFKHFAPRVKSFLKMCGASDTLAEELTQETMVSVWRKAGTFDPQRSAPSTWIFSIARNHRVDHLRRRGNHLLADEENLTDLVPDPTPSPADQVLAGEREARVRHAMSQLSPGQRQLLHLSFFEEHAHARIAHDLDLPLGTVKSRIRLAVARLRQLLEGLDR
ncbi:sigma-70 family RNA polymerase sigma factor [Variovorax boronicumulans]|uniref:sigma-70 family RNA polymerase sigma factor n=1 Tax=Variovorax boronicumulans TaxID=436515 RepID=UPI0027D90464|nr:sigma-70 family RNA polymerase sigma factor [Variovorax boronicumulans]